MTPELGAKLQQITEQNIMDIEAHKQQGKSVVGYYCLYGPTELAVAADAIPLPLCGTRQDPIEAAEHDLAQEPVSPDQKQLRVCRHRYLPVF